ncbi:hypothetical protein L7F22_065176 [Adiantum nelumboides]|nr:hypothetical protein [Adiantum nelumboides]
MLSGSYSAPRLPPPAIRASTNMEQQAQDSSSFINASTSGVLSMDCQTMDPQSAYKPSDASLHQPNINKESTSCVSSNVNDDQNEEQMEENAHCGTLQGSMIFGMLSAMQFNPQYSTNKNTLHLGDEQTNNNYLHIVNAAPSKASQDGPLTRPTNLYNSRQDNQDHQESGFQSIKDDMDAPSKHPSEIDPISNFLKLPVLVDPTRLELVDQRLLSSYSSYMNSYKEDSYAPTSLGNSNNWFNSLQLENVRPECVLNNIDDQNHIVQFLDHANEQSALEQANLVLKLNKEGSNIHTEDDSLLSDRYTPSSLHIMSSYHNEEQLLYALNEGSDIQRGQGETMFDHSMQMMMMGYTSENARHNEEYGVIKGSASSVGTNAPNKTGRRRGARGSIKNSEERETQRMTHIAVERNRRRQMNEHLRVLRALMPPSYIQRGDQASIIGGAIEFVRELEQLLQCLESQKRRRIMANPPSMQQPIGYNDNHLPLQQQQQEASLAQHLETQEGSLQTTPQVHEEVAQAKSAMVDIEVKVVEGSEALIKILSQRRPRQLLHTIIALQDHLNFCILHTNVTTIDNTVLYSFTVKMY